MNRRGFLKAVAAVFGTVVAEPLARAIPAEQPLTYTYEVDPVLEHAWPDGDFTIEFWMRGDPVQISDFRITKGVARYMNPPTDDQWHHYALRRKGDMLEGFKDAEPTPVKEVPVEILNDEIRIADGLALAPLKETLL